MNTTTDNKQAIRDYISQLGLTMTATFQPTPQPAATVKYPQLHWIVTIRKGARHMQAPYFEGCGHVKGYERTPTKTPYDRRLREEAIRKTCETGHIYKQMFKESGYTIAKGTQPAPDFLDVLYCLVSDSSVLGYATYEDWGPELDYDADSRKGEAIYRACLAQSLALQNLIGHAALQTLRDLFQDY